MIKVITYCFQGHCQNKQVKLTRSCDNKATGKFITYEAGDRVLSYIVPFKDGSKQQRIYAWKNSRSLSGFYWNILEYFSPKSGKQWQVYHNITNSKSFRNPVNTQVC